MRKGLYAILAALAVFALVMTGCDTGGGGGTEDDDITISFKVNLPASYDGSIPTVPDPVKIKKGKGLSGEVLNTAELPGQDTDILFNGWFKAASGGNRLTVADTFSANADVYAQWELIPEDSIVITFGYNYGAESADLAKQPADYKVIIVEGEAVGDKWPADPVRAGYTFIDWVQFENGMGDVYTKESTTWPTGANGSVLNKVWATWQPEGGPIVENPPESIDLTGVEKVTTQNGLYPIYIFTLPSGKTWADYKEISATIMAGPSQFRKSVGSFRLLGNYTNGDFQLDEIKGGAAAGKTVAIAGDGQGKNGPFIFDQDASFSNGAKKLEDVMTEKGGKATAEAWTWFTITHSIVNVTSHSAFLAVNKPADSDTGPFYYGIGVPGQGGDLITSYVKDVTLVGYVPADNVIAKPLVFESGGKKYPAYMGYNTFTDGSNGLAQAERVMADGTAFTTVNVDITITKDLNYANAPAGGTVTTQKGKGLTDADLARATQAGQGFVGWYKEAAGTNLVTTSTTFDATATIYAKWAAPITITYDVNGGTGTAPAALTNVGTGGTLFAPELVLPETVTKTGYKFIGWSTTQNDADTKVTVETTFSASATIYAIWKFNPDPITLTAPQPVVHTANNNTDDGSLTITGKKVTVDNKKTRTNLGFYYDITTTPSAWSDFDNITFTFTVTIRDCTGGSGKAKLTVKQSSAAFTDTTPAQYEDLEAGTRTIKIPTTKLDAAKLGTPPVISFQVNSWGSAGADFVLDFDVECTKIEFTVD